jgi:hypothetical protein
MLMKTPSVSLPQPAVNAARILVAFWLLGWFIKLDFFWTYLFDTIVHYPFEIGLFPPFLRSPEVAQCFYVMPLFSLIVFLRRQKFYFYLSAAIMVLSSAVLLLHQDMHNDATFETSFWTGVWFLWFVTQMHREDEAFFYHARSLALCAVALIFWGGFVGKLTPEYWNGQVMGNIFMEQNYGLIGGWVRSYFSEAEIRFYFQWISKFVILGEGMLALSPLWPYRFVCFAGIPFMAGISLFTTWRIFSVLFCLIGLLIAGLQLKKR